jgi:ribosome maturation factor RimP
MPFDGHIDKKEIEAQIEDFLFRSGFELVDLKIEFNPTRPLVEVFADKLGGITVRDLSKINGRLNLFLEASDFFPSSFSLIVSSPGLDRVVKKEADFKRFAGRRISIQMESQNGKASGKKEAVLMGYEDGQVLVEMSDGNLSKIDLKDVKRIRLVPDLDFSRDKDKE